MTPNMILQRGFALISAIFLLVVLGALAAYIVSISSSEHYTSLYALQSAKAYYAARAGIEWGAATALPPGGGGACPGTTSFSPGGTLSNFSVTVKCSATSYYETPYGNYNVYVIDSTASSITPPYGSPGYASRHIVVTMTNAQ